MRFNSVQYILFIVLITTLFWMLSRNRRGRTVLLLLASWLFYMTWNPYYIVLIIGSTVWDYWIGRGLEVVEAPGTRKLLVTASVLGNLGMLGVFKYYNFFVEATGDTLRFVHGVLETNAGVDWAWMLTATDSVPVLDVILPVGISFYTFQTMSYTLDVYRRNMPATRDFLQFATFVAFFPQLVAGPIVRAKDFLPQLVTRPKLDIDSASRGLYLIALGMIKKVVFADFVAVNLVDRVFDNPAGYTSLETLVGLYGYTVQIYCDFSGYSDIAIGTGLLMGFRLPDNFDRPYIARNPAEFWRRWHMTLSTWLRDYLYYPLGGSRRGNVRTYINLFLTLFLIGIWHGADWTFVVYGAMHATSMVLHRLSVKTFGKPAIREKVLAIVGKVFLMFHFTVLSRILFRAPTIDNAGAVWDQLFVGTWGVANVSWSVGGLIVGCMLLHWTPRPWASWLQQRFVALPAPVQSLLLAAAAVLCAVAATGEAQPYIYQQF